MTKIEAREIATAKMAKAHGMDDMAARTLSGVYRAAMSGKTQREVLEIARALGVDQHEDFIV
jgi:hypothetical protein